MPSLQQILLRATLFSSLVSLAGAQSSTFITSTATSALIPSQSTAILPQCASACVQTAINVQSCAPGDEACLCSVASEVQESADSCLKTTSCSSAEQESAYGYFPQHCKDLGLAIDTNVPTVIATAAETAPSTSSTDSSSLGIGTQSATTPALTKAASNDNNTQSRLQLPAILGIVLVVVLLIVGVMVLSVWSFLRRRQMLRRPRMDLGGEFVEPRPRPSRSKSVESEFKVEPPPPVEKDVFGESLSRSSTLVPPPPIAKDGNRTSEQKRNSARNRALKMLLGGDGLRASFMSSRASSKQASLIVPPLDIRKSQEDHFRMSKF